MKKEQSNFLEASKSELLSYFQIEKKEPGDEANCNAFEFASN
jgi:hypothetical protein